MQEFSSISVSTYEAEGLVGQLNDKASDGWSVVSIVPTGSTITAYLSRDRSDDAPGSATSTPSIGTTDHATNDATDDATDSATDAADESTFASTAAVGAIGAESLVPEPAPEPAVEPASAPAAEATFPPVAAEPAAAPEPAPEPAAQTAATSAAPAGWYADPSGRYELRYWDGGTWTEHVSRAGQQYTDPPVA